MHDAQLETMAPAQLRAGVRVSSMSIAWTLASSVAAIGLGLGAGSLVLVAFGAAGLLDACGSTILVIHFRHALRHEAISESHERLALGVVAWGLVALGGFTVAESARRLAGRTEVHAVPGGVALAAVSIGVLGWLSHRKHLIARKIPSRALRADGWLSATGCGLAVVTVAGTGLASTFGWWWADPVAAAGVGFGAMGIAIAMTRGRDRTDPGAEG